MIQSSEPFGKAILMAVWRMDWMEMGQGGVCSGCRGPDRRLGSGLYQKQGDSGIEPVAMGREKLSKY